MNAYYGNDTIELFKSLSDSKVAGLMTASTGYITSIDAKKYAAKVKLEPLGIETGWLPLGSFYTGNEFGLFALPAIDDEVTVIFEMGNINIGKIICANFNSIDNPIEIEPGEVFLKHKSGSTLKFYNNGNVDLIPKGVLNLGGDIPLARKGDGVQVSGSVNGRDVTLNGTITQGTDKIKGG